MSEGLTILPASTPRRRGRLPGKVQKDRQKDQGLLMAVNSLSALAGSKDALRMILSAAPETDGLRRFLKEMQLCGSPLSVIASRVGMQPWTLVKHFTAGLREVKRAEAERIALQGAPALIEDMQRNALDKVVRCPECKGKGHTRKGEPCHVCDGDGQIRKHSEHKQWSAEKLLKLTKLVEDRPSVEVNNTQQIALGAGFAESLAKAGYAALRAEVVEGEKVEGGG